MRNRVLSFTLRENATADLDGGTASGLESVIDFLRSANGAARICPLDATGRTIAQSADWHVVAPRPCKAAPTQAINFVHLPHDAPVERLQDALRNDPRVARVDDISPDPPRAVATPDPHAAPDLAHDWAIAKCGFPQVWSSLEQGPDDPGGIVVIDDGRPAPGPHSGFVFHDLPTGTSSSADHAAAVVGLVAPHRGTVATAFGCSSARVDLYNVFDDTGTIDKSAIATALVDATKRKTAAINMSFTLLDMPNPLEVAIQACVEHEILLVASMGKEATPDAVFPAQHPAVLAIAGTTPDDTMHPGLLTGNVFLAAPAERVESVGGFWTGTSFAAPMVTAAIWLARRKRPDLSASEIRNRLRQSGVNPHGIAADRIGGGRLDMPTLAARLAEP